MGICVVKTGLTNLTSYLPLIAGDKIPQELDEWQYFKQLESVDVSKYDLRQVRGPHGSQKTRTENGVIHSKSTPTILYQGEEIQLHGSRRTENRYEEWHAYPHMTVGFSLLKTYERYWRLDGGWKSGTYISVSFFFIVEKADPVNPGRSRIAGLSLTPKTVGYPYEGHDFVEYEGYGSRYWTGRTYVGSEHTDENCHNFFVPLGKMSYHAQYGDHSTKLEDWEITSPGLHSLISAAEVFMNDRPVDISSSTSGLEIRSVDPTFAFLLGENGFPDGYGKINYVLSEHYRTLMEQHAYLDALTSVQHAWDNGITNVMEFVKFFVNLFVHHKVEIPKNWKDGWLSYRYVYSTTKLDQEELASDILNGLNKILQDGKRYVKVRGNYSMNVADSHVKCTCQVYLKNQVYDFLDNCRIALERFGLVPDLYVLWDMTPYSFIFDWFLPIGNTLDVLDASKVYDGDNCIYEIGPVTFSFKYTRDIEGTEVSLYSRRVTSKPVIQAFYWFVEPSSTNVKTWGKRIIDGFALFT